MTAPKLTLTVQLMHANARIAELEAQLTLERAISAASFHTALAHAEHVVAQPIITHYSTSDGTQWIKTRVGNRAVSRQVLSN